MEQRFHLRDVDPAAQKLEFPKHRSNEKGELHKVDHDLLDVSEMCELLSDKQRNPQAVQSQPQYRSALAAYGVDLDAEDQGDQHKYDDLMRKNDELLGELRLA